MIKKIIKELIKEWVEIVGIATIVTFIWQSVELIITNEINTNMVDTIISLPIVLLLHFEYKKNIGNIE